MILQTTRLLLRELCLDDVPALNAIERDPRVTRFMPFDPQSDDQTRAYIENAMREQTDDPRRTYDLAIAARDESSCAAFHAPGALMGRCGLGIRRPEHREAVIWYELNPTCWGQGYALEAASALVDFGFRKLGLHRIWADCDPRNTASCRVAERLGMKLEGQLRENYFLKGEWCSTAVYGLLEGEWDAAHLELNSTKGKA